MSPSDTLRSLGRTAVGAAALFVLYPLAFAAGFISTLAGPAWRASAPDPLQRGGRDLSAYLAARRREREALARAKVRAEVRAAKAAKREAREERKRLRRAAVAGPWAPEVTATKAVLKCCVEVATGWRRAGRPIGEMRQALRDAELQYAIACAAAGAVPK